MANTQAMCTSFKKELLTGGHNFGAGTLRASSSPDTFMASLRLATDNLGPNTTTYSATGEVSGTGYTPGGMVISGWANPSTSGSAAFTTPTQALTWVGVTLSTPFDALLIYNQSQGGKAVSVHTFGAQTVVAGNFTITMPVNAAGTALLQLT